VSDDELAALQSQVDALQPVDDRFDLAALCVDAFTTYLSPGSPNNAVVARLIAGIEKVHGFCRQRWSDRRGG